PIRPAGRAGVKPPLHAPAENSGLTLFEAADMVPPLSGNSYAFTVSGRRGGRPGDSCVGPGPEPGSASGRSESFRSHAPDGGTRGKGGHGVSRNEENLAWRGARP